MEFQNIANIFPLLDNDKLNDLAENIKQNGLLNPIIIFENKILDGRNRYLACEIASVEPVFVIYQGNDPLNFVVSQNLHRRHLSESQRSLVADNVANLRDGLRKDHAEGASIDAPVSQSDEQLASSDAHSNPRFIPVESYREIPTSFYQDIQQLKNIPPTRSNRN